MTGGISEDMKLHNEMGQLCKEQGYVQSKKEEVKVQRQESTLCVCVCVCVHACMHVCVMEKRPVCLRHQVLGERVAQDEVA
jgi:hypothetical protein